MVGILWSFSKELLDNTETVGVLCSIYVVYLVLHFLPCHQICNLASHHKYLETNIQYILHNVEVKTLIVKSLVDIY